MSSEIHLLGAKVDELAEEVRQMKRDHSDFSTLKARVVALEKSNEATGQRLSHMDSILLEMQVDVRSLKRAVTDMQVVNSRELGELRDMLKRVLDAVTSD